MKNLVFVLISLLVTINMMLAQQTQPSNKENGETTRDQGTVYYTGGRGEFEYPWIAEKSPEFVVWVKANNGGKVGIVGGIVTPTTKIIVLNKKVSKDNLDLLSGKEVAVLGKFRTIGNGEGVKNYCEELFIVIIFRNY